MAGMHETGTIDLQAAMTGDPDGFPFRTELSLEAAIHFWTEGFCDDGPVSQVMIAALREQIAQAPDLRGVITDPAVLDRHADLVDFLMAAAFPPALWEQEFGAALIPFSHRVVYATPAFARWLMTPDGYVQGRIAGDSVALNTKRRLFAAALILKKVYGIDLGLDYPLVITATDPETGLDRHFKLQLDGRFVDVVPVRGEAPPLPADACERLHAELLDPALIPQLLPPDRFVIRGFTICRAVDVTDQEVVSSIKKDLIDKDSVVSNERFLAMETKLRTLLRRPELRLGLAALEGDRVLVLDCSSRHQYACIFADSAHHTVAEFAGSIFERAVKENRLLIIDDLATLAGRTSIEEQMVANGLRSAIVAPLEYQGRVIGTLELTSPHARDLNATLVPKLEQVLPLFSMAARRSMDELNTRVQAMIKEKCTAIHPSVEWRFRQAVLNAVERGSADLEPIVFSDLYPLYGLSDIRGSSTQRALAIQADLRTQLQLAHDVVDAAHRARALPALHELLYRVDHHLGQIEPGLRSGDEVETVAFLRRHVEPLFDHIQRFGSGVRGRVVAYRTRLDPRLGTVYDRRRRFEESVTGVTDMISGYLDLEEQAAQGMFPHYFEKQMTDGVDHQIYVGAALVEGGEFTPLYLKNLRLWQLMVTCGIALRTHQLRDRLAIPLETTHLVLVQHMPLAIRFRTDEKRFDVDGAYNIRYEIIKKRIDKALIRGTTERVTQPDRIAIVYGQPAEAAEYRSYVEYLQHLGYLKSGVEDVELEELQGVSGLRALRVAVEVDNPRHERSIALDELPAAH
jgi:hypothetical protein